MNRDRVLDALMRDEGFAARPYLDSVGKTTIGFGRNLTDNPLTKHEAYRLLDGDLDETIRSLDSRLSWWRDLPDAAQEVLVNMAYNLGVVKLQGFVLMLDALKKRDFSKAAYEMRHSRWAAQVGARAERLAKQMEGAK